MKVVVLYRPNSEHARSVENFISDFRSEHSDLRLEVLNIDSRDGMATASLYDIVQYPAVLVLRDDGYAQNIWQGEHLPLMRDVLGYVTA